MSLDGVDTTENKTSAILNNGQWLSTQAMTKWDKNDTFRKMIFDKLVYIEECQSTVTLQNSDFVLKQQQCVFKASTDIYDNYLMTH